MTMKKEKSIIGKQIVPGELDMKKGAKIMSDNENDEDEW
jgi:hypothetical protein